ncbi:dnaJ homolog subfamily C member 3 [Diachasma alloeum]|uniref:dnaJ homolog subfamily C member 3 n=1 Tax=Diachasma alloeum TaxID=454923 RepID=UPI0007382844|nr:dnaJ homolog subfamily C member 3 [Diachasma alloeum]
MYSCGLLLVLLNLSSDVGGSVSQAEVDRHLEQGREFLAMGKLQDALTEYHSAVRGDPNNYLTYYKRGAVFLALSKSKQALQDFDKVLQLKSDFTAARLQRAKILWKQAEFAEAEQEYQNVLDIDQDNAEALAALNNINSMKMAYSLAKQQMDEGHYSTAVELLTQIIEFSPWALELREHRAHCHVALGNHLNAIPDMRASTKLLPDNTLGYFKLSTTLYQLGMVEDSLREIRECLRLDSEHNHCLPFYKKLRKISKKLKEALEAEESRDFETCVSSALSILDLEPIVDNVRFIAHHFLCKYSGIGDDPNLAIKHCQQAVKVRREPGILCDSAEAYLNAEMFDDAIRDAKEALEMDEGFQRAKELLQKAQQEQKRSERRDYYKILGVHKTATKQEIIKAYRKAAQKWHPDNFQDGTEKKKAEKKFIDIAAAKEVLTDEEKRRQFDRGEDPLDPESGKHSGFNPFQEFHRFHGSPFQFKFHFN